MMEFKSPGAFAAHLQRTLPRLTEAEFAGVRAGVEMWRDEAKAVLGDYQRENTGPFEPWQELADATQEERGKQGYPENDPLRRQGLLHDNIEASAEGREGAMGVPDREVKHEYQENPVNIGEVAEALELGTRSSPPRSFLGMTAFRYGASAAALIGSMVAAALAGMTAARRRPAE